MTQKTFRNLSSLALGFGYNEVIDFTWYELVRRKPPILKDTFQKGILLTGKRYELSYSEHVRSE
jgi:hypothetical protein